MSVEIVQPVQPLAPTLEPLMKDHEAADVRSALDRVSSMGFRFVQLSSTQPGMRPRDLDRSARRDLLATLRRRELNVAGVDAWIPPRHLLDPQHADRAVSALLQAIELAADLGRCSVSFTLPAAPNESGEIDAIVKLLSTHADRSGVRLADHAVPIVMREGSLIQIGIDPAAWLAQGGDPIAAVLTNGSNLGAARLCDLLTSGMRGPIGDRQERQLDVARYKIALSVGGYRHPLVVDARQWTDRWHGLEQTMQVWNASP